jgi:hypothetical protein
MVGILLLAACSKSNTSASSAPSVSVSVPTLPTSAPTSEAGSDPTSDFCTALKVEKVKLAALTKNIGTAVVANDVQATKQNLATYITAVTQAIAEVETTMSSAPADVQAAIQVFNSEFTQLPSKIQSATTMQGIATAFSSFASDPQMKAASDTLSAYSRGQCGSLSSSSP